MEPKSTPKFLQWAIAAAFVITINLFFHYVIALVYSEPKYENFCPIQTQNYTTAESCVGNGGQWTNNFSTPQEITKAVKDGQPIGYCNPNFTCQKSYDDAHSIYNRNVFGILIILSVVVLGMGAMVGIEVLSLGLSWAGVLSLIIASLQYWSDANNLIRVVILAIALVLLTWLVLKRFKD